MVVAAVELLQLLGFGLHDGDPLYASERETNVRRSHVRRKDAGDCGMLIDVVVDSRHNNKIGA